MLKFDNMRKLTNKMMDKSFAYAEVFLQKVFDSLNFDEDYTFADSYEFYRGVFPEDADPQDVFENMYFKIEYDCTGAIWVSFKSENFSSNALPCSILQEVLLKNGFNRSDEESLIIFNRNI